MMRWLLLWLCWVAPLAAQDARLVARLDSATARQVQQLVDSAHRAGLPGEPLVLKALEGQSKNAAPPRILAAVRGLFAALGTARAALGEGATSEEIVAGANVLRTGVSAAEVAALRRDRGREVTVPLDVWADLVARGVPIRSATRAVTAMVHQGAPDRDFFQLRAQVERDILTGLAPESALERRLPGLPAAAPPRQP